MNGASEKQIIRELSRVMEVGRRSHEVFQDFLAITEATLNMLPRHAASVKATGAMAEDDEQTKAVWERLRKTYPDRRYFDLLATAFRILVDLTKAPGGGLEYNDVLGNVYMQFAYPNPGTGQYFTPFPLAKMMAAMSIGDGQLVYDRMNEAAAKCSLDLIYTFSPKHPLANQHFFERFGGVLMPHFQPVMVQDCCCGSGVMFLAAASCLPAWITQMGLVQFYGQDLDKNCVAMSTINLMLYGMNGFAVKCALALSGAEIAAVPEPQRERYREAIEANEAGNQTAVEAVVKEARAVQVEQVKQKITEGKRGQFLLDL